MISLFHQIDFFKNKPIFKYKKIEYFDNKLLEKTQKLSKEFYYLKKNLKKNSFFYKITELEYKLDNINYLSEIFNSKHNKNTLLFQTSKNNTIKFFDNKKTKKYNSIIQDMNDMNNNYEKNKSLITTYYLSFLLNVFDILDNNGTLLFKFSDYYCNYDSNEISFIYLLSCMFEKIILYNGNFIYCNGFKGNDSLINKYDINNLIEKNNIYYIDNIDKKSLKDIINYYNNIFNFHNELYQYFIDKDYDKYIDLYYITIYNNIKSYDLSKEIKITINKLLLTFLKRTFVNKNVKKINSSIKNSEGSFISDIIKKYNYKKCLEVGFAFGISAFYILSNPNTTLISIDPFQKSQWNNYGKKLLKSFDLNKRHKCIEKKSYEALPELLNKIKKDSDKFDFIFIDGWHTFDYTLVDFFYSNLMLKIGGIIIVDDVLHLPVTECIEYLDKNYLFYKKIHSPNTIACYQKIKEDDRVWNFHVSIK